MRKFLCLIFGLLAGSIVHADSSVQDLPKEVVINGVEFVLIPGGPAWFPIPDIDPRTGYTRRSGIREVRVWTDTYYIGKYEARGSDFARFMNAGVSRYEHHYDPPRKSASDGATQGSTHGCAVRKDQNAKYYLIEPQADLPATHLSWDLSNEFAAWMGFRLPTEAEWVRAFRSDSRNNFPWGNEYPDDTFAGFQEGATECAVRPVTAFPKGRSPYGVYNMAGNVFEYVADWYDPAHYDQLRDGARNPVAAARPAMPNGEQPMRRLRGGRWASGVGELAITGNWDTQPSEEPFRCFGARFALDVTTVQRHLSAGTAVIR